MRPQWSWPMRLIFMALCLLAFIVFCAAMTELGQAE